jgi:hypothetical protein
MYYLSKGYLKIIETLSAKKSGLTRNEIIKEGKLEDNGLLTEMLKNLKDSLFVRAHSGIMQSQVRMDDLFSAI